MASRTENSIKNITAGIGLKLLLMVLQFVSKTIFVRYLDDYLGVNALITSVMSYLNITELGISSAIIFAMFKPIAQKDNEKIRQYLSYYKKIYYLLGVATIAIGVVMAFFLPFMMDINEVGFTYVQIYIIYILYVISACYGYFVYAYRGGYLDACQEAYRITPITAVSQVFIIIIQIVSLIILKSTFISYVIYTAIPIVSSVITSLIIAYVIGKWHPSILVAPKGKLSKEEIKDLFKNTYGLALDKICTVINNSIDNIIISSLIGVVILGKYSLYFSIISLVSGFVSVIFTSLTPSVGNLNSEAAVQKKKDVFNIINFNSVCIYGFCSVMYIALIQPFMVVWAGGDKLLGLFVPVIVALNFLTQGMTSAVSIFRSGCGLYFKGRRRPIFYTAANIVLSYVLGSVLNKYYGEVWGIFGIVAATVVSRMSVMWWYDAKIVFKYVFEEKYTKYLTGYLYDLFLIIATGVISYFVCSCLPDMNIWVMLILRALITFIIIVAVFCLFYHKRTEYKAMKTKITGILSSAFRKLKRG